MNAPNHARYFGPRAKGRQTPSTSLRDAIFDVFGDQFLVGGAGLFVAVAAALLHGADRAHAVVLFVAAALEQDQFTRGLVGAGE